jgi:hypothetical protein
VSKLKKKKESLAISSHDSTLHNAPVTIPIFAIQVGCVPTKITVIYVFADIDLILAVRLRVRPLSNIRIFQLPAHPTLMQAG